MPLTSRFNVHKCTWHTYFLFTHAFSTLGSFSEISNFCLCSSFAKTFMERTLEQNRGKIYFDIIPRFALKIYELCFCVLMVNALFRLPPRDISFLFDVHYSFNNKTFLFSGMLVSSFSDDLEFYIFQFARSNTNSYWYFNQLVLLKT